MCGNSKTSQHIMGYYRQLVATRNTNSLEAYCRLLSCHQASKLQVLVIVEWCWVFALSWETA